MIEQHEVIRHRIDVAALRQEIARMVQEEAGQWEYSTTELDERWPPSKKIYKRLEKKQVQEA